MSSQDLEAVRNAIAFVPMRDEPDCNECSRYADNCQCDTMAIHNSDLHSGMKLRLLREVQRMPNGSIVEIDYPIPMYGKIIVSMDDGSGVHCGACLYLSDQFIDWEPVE